MDLTQTNPLSGIRSPKRKSDGITSRANWFPYYAGFSVGFVEDIISHLDLAHHSTLLDPWLGAGTTAEVATLKGFQLRGYDLNPAMLLVARARTIPPSAVDQLPALTERISHFYERGIKNNGTSRPTDDPLEQWLQPASTAAFRLLEQIIDSFILKLENRSSAIPVWRRAGQASPLLSLFYLALFRSLRHFISGFQGSNPTWVKISTGGERIQLSADRIVRRFGKEVESLASKMQSEVAERSSVDTRTFVIDQASSLRLPISSNSVDAIVSSPPYCTRIDYVKATLPELAIIGYPNGDIMRLLRDKMIGTPTINKKQDYDGVTCGATCSRFLSAVQDHSSKASSTYYLKYYRQYFGSVLASLREIDRVLKKSCRCVLVVQDSYYKEIKIDLPQMFIDMGEELGWSLIHKMDFEVRQTLAGVNPDVKTYRKTFNATESALVFSK